MSGERCRKERIGLLLLEFSDIFQAVGKVTDYEHTIHLDPEFEISDFPINFSVIAKHVRCSPYYPRSNGKIERLSLFSLFSL